MYLFPEPRASISVSEHSTCRGQAESSGSRLVFKGGRHSIAKAKNMEEGVSQYLGKEFT